MEIASEQTPIDPAARAILANALSGFMQGRIASRRFNDTVVLYWSELGTEDRSVWSIAEVLYDIYDDFRDEPIDVSEEDRQALVRALVFLGTDLVYSYENEDLPAQWDQVRKYWPFASEEEGKVHAHLRPTTLPEYDPDLLPYEPKSELRAWGEVIGIVLLVVLLFLGLIVGLWAYR